MNKDLEFTIKNKESVISHVAKDRSAIQSNADHLAGVARLARKFAEEFSMGNWGEALGLLHDIGKQRGSFQNYIRKVSGLDPQANWHGEDKRHAFVGAILAKQLFPAVYPLLSFPIMGHHGGLDDYGDLSSKMDEKFPDDVEAPSLTLNLDLPNVVTQAVKRNPNRAGMYFQAIIRMLYSCLVDADFLDTEAFMTPASYSLRKGKKSITELLPKLEAYLDNLKKKSQSSTLNTLRQNIQDICRVSAKDNPDFYSLTVPTGGGKTLSSLLWAMYHCVQHSKKRIIIAIPYTSIVTQTATTLSEIFGMENVLEHHSNFNPDDAPSPELRQQMKLATENWDYPIVVTTNVQLFTSMFANKPSKCRKLHNIVNSVIILDEPQMLPTNQLQPLVDALMSHRDLFGTTILLTTASLPVINGDIRGASAVLYGIPHLKEIIPTDWKLHEKLKRVNIKDIIDEQTPESICGMLQTHSKVLCIVNTRHEAKAIYELLPDEGLTLHLSRMMCSAHLKKNIGLIKNALSKVSESVVRVVATQLLEAGVDIDFPVVYRQEAGLDSVLQAAGRCNREGQLKEGTTYVFRLPGMPHCGIRQGCYSYQSLPKDADKLDPATMRQYYMQLYSRTSTFDKHQITSLLYDPRTIKFEEAAREFSLIDNNGLRTVYVNYECSPKLIEELRFKGPSYILLKRLSMYAVNVHKKDFDILLGGGFIEVVRDVFYYIPDPKQYDSRVGLITANHWLEEILMIV